MATGINTNHSERPAYSGEFYGIIRMEFFNALAGSVDVINIRAGALGAIALEILSDGGDKSVEGAARDIVEYQQATRISEPSGEAAETGRTEAGLIAKISSEEYIPVRIKTFGEVSLVSLWQELIRQQWPANDQE